MGKLSLYNKGTQDNYNARIALEIQSGTACFLRSINGWELLNLAPYNYKSGKIYEGQNFVNLLNSAISYKSGAFLTFNQIKEMGGFVKDGQQAQQVIFWNFAEKYDKETGEKVLGKDDKTPIKYAFLKRFNVFNIAQTTLEDLPTKSPAPKDTEQLQGAVLNFVNNNQGLINAKSYNEFFAKWATQKANEIEDNMCEHWGLKVCLIAELVNLFICAKIGADFNPIYNHHQEMWAKCLENGFLDFIKCAKTAKKIGDEMLTWQNLKRISA